MRGFWERELCVRECGFECEGGFECVGEGNGKRWLISGHGMERVGYGGGGWSGVVTGGAGGGGRNEYLSILWGDGCVCGLAAAYGVVY